MMRKDAASWWMRWFLLFVVLMAMMPVNDARAVWVSSQSDIVGPEGSFRFGYSVTVLPNGNWVIVDPYYRNQLGKSVGAAYLYDGKTSTLISQLAGSSADDHVGLQGVVVLTNGNYLVLSRDWDNPAAPIGGVAVDAGAVTWCSAEKGCSGVISAANSLVGGRLRDRVGNDGVVLLPNGHYVVRSTLWDNGEAANAGAVTWCPGDRGCAGSVSAANSLVGLSASDKVGGDGVMVLANGNYLVRSSLWDDRALRMAKGQTNPYAGLNVGAVTWCSGETGCVGAVSPANSLVGSSVSDQVGADGVVELPNGGYLVQSLKWDNGLALNAGALTWCDGRTGCVGRVSPANSLVGSKSDDRVGSGVTVLANGNYVVWQNLWDRGNVSDAGAVTWCRGVGGCTGIVSPENSLVGSSPSDQLGSHGVVALSNGDYVVRSSFWNDGMKIDVGAVTLCKGDGGCRGEIDSQNSLIGQRSKDQIGSNGVVELPNGNYVVVSSFWDHNLPQATSSAVDAGAVTWCSGQSGCTGIVSDANSLVGSVAYDEIGRDGIIVLPNGNYVVRSLKWNQGYAVDVGAVTWCRGDAGCQGEVSPSNSLVGSHDNDRVGSNGIVVLSSGDYLVSSERWHYGTAASAGALTWCQGDRGCTGVVSPDNSLVGSTRGDTVGSGGVVELPDGNYVVLSPAWDQGSKVNAGAVTWCQGQGGCVGTISAENSLVGSSIGDVVGFQGVVVLSNGNYVVPNSTWDDPAPTKKNPVEDVGAITWCRGDQGCQGVISAENSLVGSNPYDRLGIGGVIAFSNGNYLAVSTFWDNDTLVNAGAVTWCAGDVGCRGDISPANSLIGSKAYDKLGNAGVWLLENGRYAVISSDWDSALAKDAGVISLGSEANPVLGSVTSENSVWGDRAAGGKMLTVMDDRVHGWLIVARPGDNVVTVIKQAPQP